MFEGTPISWTAVVITAAALPLALVNRYPRGWVAVLARALVGIGFYASFLMWAYADPSGVRSAITNPLPGTSGSPPPLVFGALAGVLCERAGVINIAIEGQFIAGAFFGSVFSSFAVASLASIPLFWCPVFGLLGGILAGVGVAAMLALFSLRYYVDQVVVGVVLVAFGYGITSFLLGQIPEDREEQFNNPQLLEAVQIPVLHNIPYIGEALFGQNLLVYIAYVSVPAVVVPALPDPVGPAGPLGRRAPQGRRHGGHRSQPNAVAGRAARRRVRRSGRRVLHAERPVRSTRR